MADLIPQGGTRPDQQPAHNPIDDVHVGRIVRFGVGLAGFTLAVALILGLVMRAAEEKQQAEQTQRPLLFAREPSPEGAPTLQVDPARDLLRLRQAQERRLSQYGWVERGKIARIPIDRAIELLVERGLPRVEAMPAAAEPTPTDAVRRARANPRPQPPVGEGPAPPRW